MEKNEKREVDNPRRGANFLSVVSFKWLLTTFITGYKRELEVDDLYSPLEEHASGSLGNKVSKLWKDEEAKCCKLNNKSKPSLLRVLARCFGRDILTFGIFLGINELLIRTAQPILLISLLRYFANEQSVTQLDAFYWATGILMSLLLATIFTHPALQGLTHIGMKVRVACCSLIYRKILKVTKVVAEGKTSAGQMINLLSNDVNRLDYSAMTLHYMWIAPIQTIIITYLLYKEVHMATLGGIVILLLFMPIYGCCGKLVTRLTVRFSEKTDERLRLTNEVISGIKVIKMYAWEKPFANLIDKAREKEVKTNRNNSMATDLWYDLECYIPRICIFLTILLYILFGNDINVEKVYLVTAYYNVLRTSLYRYFTLGIKEFAEALVSIKRLQKFLFFDEIESEPSRQNNGLKFESKTNSAVSFKNVSAKWSANSSSEILKQLSLDVKAGSLTVLVGQVGSGKTTLLHAILNEIPHVRGEIRVNGEVSYASQEPWLFASSVRQNILFGQPMDEKRYERVVDACQLRRDFGLLPHGDGTLVGERGLNLSGGQCARVNLARAVYREADVYLLDDPLSAVDARVGQAIFKNCLMGLLKGKTVLLSTHQLQFLRHADQVLVLAAGRIQAQGSYVEVLQSGLDLVKIMQLESEPDGAAPVNENEVVVVESTGTGYGDDEEELAESRTRGKISAKTYAQYFKTSGGYCYVFFVFCVAVVSQAVCSSADYFTAYWVNVEEKGGNFTPAGEHDPFRGRGNYVYIYSSINLSMILFLFIQSYMFFDMTMKICRNLHAMMFNSIIRTTMGFFNANPVGRIMNRFSKDMGIIDTRVPRTVLDVSTIFIYFIVVIGIIASVNYWLLIPSLCIGLIAYFIHKFYVKAGRSIKRLEGITRSPVFNHISASLQGLTTIRALKAQSILTKEFDSHQDLHSSAWFIFFSGSRAFGMYIELLCGLFTGVVVYVLVWMGDTAMAGDAGLVVTQCILLTGMLQWGIRQVTELENQMTSVERILEYSNLPAEPALERPPSEDYAVPANWPKEGRIVFQNVSMTYERQETPALRDMNFVVEPEQMIGIVGRTGAGKSSIINALFRLANVQGEIRIDDVATDRIALQKLRSKISIIPQEPVLFAGSLRMNLDPFEEFADQDLWEALEDVEMKAPLKADLGLNTIVTEGGKNFSVGQKQLLCLARAIVRNNRILVLDEATASVDPRTDELIQRAVRKKFQNATVLIIAHRLNTVMDCDKILVMDAGRVVEYDHPYNLFQQKDSIFYNMALQTGSSMFQNLFETAKSNYKSGRKCVTRL